MTRYTIEHLLELVDGDREFLVRLVEEGVIDNEAIDLDRVLLARTLWRELEVDWPGIEIILRLTDELRDARRKLAAK
ncbi:MAG TPA: hypothetical protein VLB44_03185 [Kofleriaceae bacterium]|nr:hypothetical protein [Kofleriaceae bacterium]